jgi:hypothetical protein
MRTQLFLASLLVAAGAAPAFADIPPPEGYVEKCTVAKQQTSTTECLDCRAWYSARDRCTNLLAPYCYSGICNSYGASAWTEVHCRTKDANAPVVPSTTLALLSDTADVTAPDGAATPPSTCAPYTPSTSTATDTSTSTATKNDSSICSVSNHSPVVRALGPLTLVLAGLVLALLRRRPRR